MSILVSFLVLGASFLFGLEFFIVALGASLLLYSRKNHVSFHFRTYKECYHFILNCLGLPTLTCHDFRSLWPKYGNFDYCSKHFICSIPGHYLLKTHFRDPDYHNRRFLCPLRLKTWPRLLVFRLQP